LFDQVRTPILEKLEVFRRSLGETSDVVAKEMFAFPDKFQRAVCLRPEGTAGFPLIHTSFTIYAFV
jgi:histidyl-tRNA synthetase